MTLPKHHRSGVTPDHAVAPPGPSRKPVMTSSKISSAPTASQAARRPARKPGRGRDQVHVGRHRLDDDARHRVVELGHDVVGRHHGVGHRPGGHAGRTGQPEHGDPAAPAGQQAVGVAVVAAVELHDPVPAGDAAGQAHRAHGRLGARRDQAHLLAPGHPVADRLGQQHLARRRRAEGGAQRRGRARRRGHHRVGVAEQDGAVGLDEVDVAGALDVDDVGTLAPQRR